MTRTRRDILTIAAAAGALAAIGGCEKLISTATERLGQGVPDSVEAPATASIDPAHHLLSRAAFGPWPGDVEHVRSIGEQTWIEQQLDRESIDDKLCDLRIAPLEEIEESAGDVYDYDKPLLRQEMARQTLLRAVYSKRQLFEVMAAFWTDHLNINVGKGDCVYLKATDDRDVIRKHALGRFRDLIRASATSPAMLVYLDGDQSAPPKPNENYGRELMELHTLGVHGGYTQHDVFEAARALTGWRVDKQWRRGTVHFDAKHHDDGQKRLLGQTIAPGGGERDVDRVVNIVCGHLATAQHIASKLVRRFVADEPPASLVQRVAGVFRTTEGDIKSMLRAILQSEEFKASAGAKFKPPFRFIASALRAVGADTHAHAPLIDYLARMGQGVFEYPTPDGYPDKASPWLGTLLWRWNFAFALTSGQVPTVNVPVEKLTRALGADGNDTGGTLFRHFSGRMPHDEERTALHSTGGLSQPPQQIALLLASPQFQWY